MTAPPDRLRTVEEFAQLTGTTVRLGRRLVAERRIRYVKVGRYVRIPDSAIAEFVESNTVEPVGFRVGVGKPTTRRRSSAASPVRLLAK